VSATAVPTLSWFKIWEDGFNTTTKKWGVDNMIAQGGWNNFTIPTCIESGDYLMRVELIGMLLVVSKKNDKNSNKL
jgi:lytic cellulose monooxygenase (C1-hydroxylating)